MSDSRELTHAQQARLLVENMTKYRAEIAIATRKIDAQADYSASRRSTTGAHADTREKVKLAPNSMYDMCEGGRNPALARMLRKMQALAYPTK